MRTEIIEQSFKLWSQEPDKARVSPVVKARANGVQAVVEAGPFSWECDLPPTLGGENKAPSPTAVLLGALAGCAVAFIRDVLAPQQGVRVDAVEVEARCRADFRGLLGMADAEPDLQELELAIDIRSPDSAEKVRGVYEAWLERCPVYLALAKPTAVKVELCHSA
jgi:uncharacterized OsmC-like protein